MAKLKVRVRTHKRKAFTISRKGKRIRIPAATVRAHAKKVKDAGLPGRTPASRRVIPPLDRRALGINFNQPALVRRKKLVTKARKVGEKAVVGRLLAIAVLTKNTNPSVSKKAKADAHYIAGAFVGKKKVPYGKGFRRKRK